MDCATYTEQVDDVWRRARTPQAHSPELGCGMLVLTDVLS